MHILVLNSGSTSLKFTIFEAEESTPVTLLKGEIGGIGSAHATLTLRDAEGTDLAPASTASQARISSLSDAIAFAAKALTASEMPAIDAIGYRVVHPGPRLLGHQIITDEVIENLLEAETIAPLHDPAAVALIRTMQSRFPGIPHIACFDTVFHETLPPEASTYAIPARYSEEGVRRYGFHGLACESVCDQLRAAGELPKRLAIAHLGGGSSVTAVLDGRSVDTSMGLTPTGGVVMSTRPGDLDPGLVVYLMRKGGDAVSIDSLLNNGSGLKALTGNSDVRTIRTAATHGDDQALFALRVFTRSVTKTLGGYLALLGGLDAIAFSGGIGEHDPSTRAEILAPMQALGIQLDPVVNAKPSPGLTRVSIEHSPVAVYIVPAEEDRSIARQVLRICQPS
ncbi:MAG TPA: acetate/propionate family kinase [Granulicella sp.]